ncbi:MAG: VOC family protein [Chloroflexi bacterium]|nr:VOC family protein [Chloroflexota bacterium]
MFKDLFLCQNTPFLWFDHQAEEAAHFYTSIFSNSEITGVAHYGDAGRGATGSATTVAFRLDGLLALCALPDAGRVRGLLG